MSSLRAIVICQKYFGNHVISSQIHLFAPLLNMRRCTLWYYSLGQFCVLQSCIDIVSPRQEAPPYLGDGSLHDRDLSCRPPPHVFVHIFHCPQFAHLPSTKTIHVQYRMRYELFHLFSFDTDMLAKIDKSLQLYLSLLRI